MSAAAIFEHELELELKPSRGWPRHLKVKRNRFGEFSVVVRGRRGPQMLAYANASASDVHVAHEDGYSVLWLGRAAFDVTAAEGGRIASKFGLPVLPAVKS